MQTPHWLTLSAAVALYALSAPAQSFVSTHSSSSGTLPATRPTSSVRDTKSIQEKKSVKEHGPSPFSAVITDGTLTVDGMIAKARLNYDVHASYIYFFVPDVGTVVVAQDGFEGAERQKKAFRGSSLTILANGHVLELASSSQFASRKGKDAYVLVDSNFRYPDTRFPVVGYGDTSKAPYSWPGSKFASTVESGRTLAPPVPKNLLPKMASPSSTAIAVTANAH